MMARCLSAVATRTKGRLCGDDADFGAVGTDTRKLSRGSLFVAIKGERFDGNEFVAAAAERGAVGAMVSELQDVALPQIEVDDTRRAFGAMAKALNGIWSTRLMTARPAMPAGFSAMLAAPRISRDSGFTCKVLACSNCATA